MNCNFYSNEQLVNIRHAERIAEANAYRIVKQAEQATAAERPATTVAFRPRSWLRQLVLRFALARA
ncbi:MAG TPA: hypothetical protein VFU22_31870 [Roseiflexaceae bacterium]|nr:hypothetical protein [Roseiflexaceae bacterium]